MYISKDTDITIAQAYNGLRGPNINIGTKDMVNDTTQVKMYTGGIGIYGYSMSKTYVYEDYSFKKYKKTTVSNLNNKINIYSGYINVFIDSDKSVAGKGTGNLEGTNSKDSGSKSGGTVSFNPEGNGIYCSGDLEILGGSTVVYGSGTGKSSPISVTGRYKVGKGPTILAMGMLGGTGKNTPSTSSQPYLSGDIPASTTGSGSTSTTSSSSSGTNKITHALKANDVIGLLNSSGNTLIGIKVPKDVTYIFYTSDKMKAMNYDLFKGGEVTGAINTYSRDGRYQTYTHKGGSSSSSSSSGTGTGTGTSTTTGPTPLTTLRGETRQ